MFLPSIRARVPKARAGGGGVREGDGALSSGGYRGSLPKKIGFLECHKSNLKPF